MPLGTDLGLNLLAERTERFTAADLEDLTRRAGLIALREDLPASLVIAAQFGKALREARPSVTPEVEREYEEMVGTLRQKAPQARQIGFLPRVSATR
ncbi:hypothetical protein [Rhizobium miluonense]|uniref:hypothetical protein n=1 Tax=Rhizobium miluonense TaxID=411945 RepID=UPI001356514E